MTIQQLMLSYPDIFQAVKLNPRVGQPNAVADETSATLKFHWVTLLIQRLIVDGIYDEICQFLVENQALRRSGINPS